MTSARENAARSISEDARDEARKELQRWSSRTLRTHREQHGVHQWELGDACCVEQSRIVRWESPLETETAPAWALLAWLRHADARIRAVGMGVLGELALDGRAVVVPLPSVHVEADDVATLSSTAKELGELLSTYGSTIQSTDRGALRRARGEAREGVIACVVVERRLSARLAELDVTRAGPRKAR